MKGMYSSCDKEGKVASLIYLMGPSAQERRLDQPVLVTHIWTRKNVRGTGYASRLFKCVLEDADNVGATLMLSICPDPGGLDYTQLKSWYSRCGFVPVEDDPGSMIRSPHAPRQKETRTSTGAPRSGQGTPSSTDPISEAAYTS